MSNCWLFGNLLTPPEKVFYCLKNYWICLNFAVVFSVKPCLFLKIFAWKCFRRSLIYRFMTDVPAICYLLPIFILKTVKGKFWWMKKMPFFDFQLHFFEQLLWRLLKGYDVASSLKRSTIDWWILPKEIQLCGIRGSFTISTREAWLKGPLAKPSAVPAAA